jgi:hypothetical protein
MKAQEQKIEISRKNALNFAVVVSGVAAVIMLALSIVMIADQITFSPTLVIHDSIIANELINLFMGIPLILLPIFQVRQKRPIGLLLWPGAFGFNLYNYTAYMVNAPSLPLFLLNLAAALANLAGLVLTLAAIDHHGVKTHLKGKAAAKLCGGVLTGLGLLFILRAIGMIVTARVEGSPLPSLELATLIADLIIGATWILVGVLLWLKKPLGYGAGLGWLFQASLLFIGLIIFLILEPLFASSPIPWMDILVVTLMGLMVFFPTWLFWRGTKSAALESAKGIIPE